MNKRPIIIDTDPGIDDAVAIAIALFSEELEVKLITTVAGNVCLDKVTHNTLKLLKLMKKEVPVAAGAAAPLLRPLSNASNVHGESGMDGFDFEEPDEHLLLKENAVEAMRRTILESPEPVTLVPIAPLTNIALLLKVFPEVKKNIGGIVMMGGSASRGNKGVMSEFNVALDPEAAKIVFHSGLPLVMAGLDVGWKALVLPEDTAKLPSLGRVGQMAHALFSKYRGGSFQTGLKMYDSCAVAYLLNPELFETADTYLDVELTGAMTAGCTIVDLKGYLGQPNNATVCLDIDLQAFRTWFLDRLGRCL